MMASTLVIIILMWFKPLNSIWNVKMETFNEYTSVVIIILFMCMSDFVPDLDMKHTIGKVYIAVIVLFVVVHIAPMLWTRVKRLQLSMKRLYNRSKCIQRFCDYLKSCFCCCTSIENSDENA